MSRPSSPILISDDEKEPAAAPVAAVPGAKDDQTPVAAAAEQGWSNDNGDEIETPEWLPDGFEMEGYYERDGTLKTTVRPSPPLPLLAGLIGLVASGVRVLAPAGASPMCRRSCARSWRPRVQPCVSPRPPHHVLARRPPPACCLHTSDPNGLVDWLRALGVYYDYI
jgi:hypothetical protein